MKKSAATLKSAGAAVTLGSGPQPLPQPTPAPTPDTISTTQSPARRRTREEFIDHTIEFWSRRSGTAISREEALRIIENVTGLFRLLDELQRGLEVKSNDATDARGDN